jgi:hypothetical protein
LRAHADRVRTAAVTPALAIVALAGAAAGLAWALLGRLRARRGAVADTVIRDPANATVVDESGAVRSVQAADLTLPAEEVERIWSPMHLERLARTYWRFLSRISLGLIQVRYGATERAVVLLTRPFVLLRFHPPEYLMNAQRGIVRWRIKDGVLVSPRGHDANGYLQIDVRRSDAQDGRARLHVEVEVANFYPSIAKRLSLWVYKATQSRIHVIVTHGFLRSLARLDLAESRVGRFARQGPGIQAPAISEVPDPPDPEPTAAQGAAGAGQP